jgi:hypothetical protein
MLTGWKEIIKYTGLSKYTLRRLVRKEGFPVKFFTIRPTTTEEAINQWFKSRLEQVKK